ncbi:DNA N-glycosylase and apurinic/apyrimidinic (AP) lyase [Hypocenomyce scalaris]|nr:DNA N-glycosylase and apurinic/apyrimidinic (AP) lyase [Hypocenomyce scalaris]
MRTSRVSQETAKIVKRLSPRAFMQRRTRSFTTSLSAYTANDSLKTDLAVEVKQEDPSDDESVLSSAFSVDSPEIEETLKHPSSRKRKRGADTSVTTVTGLSSSTVKGASSRSGGIQAEDSGNGRPRQVRRQPAKRTVTEAGEVEIHPPDNWEEIYAAVTEMRKKVLAPVDTMGCETLAEEQASPRVCSVKPLCQNAEALTLDKDKRYQTLTALQLSSQTKDTTTAMAMRRLQTELPPPGLTVENILEVDPVHLNELIYAVGFHNNKTRYIKATALILRDKFNNDIPDTIEGLISLPGVGPKMGYLCLSAAWGRTEGIGVDVHVHRITNLWRWHKTRAPEETRAALESWLPKERWHDINRLLVGFGQTICLPVGRKCGDCTLSAKGLCPSAVVERNTMVKRVKKNSATKAEGPERNMKVNEDDEKIVVKEEKTVEDLENGPATKG